MRKRRVRKKKNRKSRRVCVQVSDRGVCFVLIVAVAVAVAVAID